MRNSTLLWVSRILLVRSSRLCWVSRPERTRRSFHMILTSSADRRFSSRRVPDALTSTAGKMRLSASWRDRRSSMLPVPLNSSKITSSALEPVSTSAVARMVSEPPFSMLRAAPKNRFGGDSALGATPPGRVLAELHEALRPLDRQLGDGRVVVRRSVEGRGDDLAFHRALHVRDLLGSLV